MGYPYLPDVLKRVVERVSETTNSRAEDPFLVFFEYGIYNQVARSMKANPDRWPLIWLIMDFIEERGGIGAFADIDCMVLILAPTEASYSMQEREENVFIPRLFPVYEEFMEELAREEAISTLGKDSIQHRRILRPYWAMGDVNGTDNKNLLDQFVDGIALAGLKFKLRYSRDCP